jgi:hypothetical protein
MFPPVGGVLVQEITFIRCAQGLVGSEATAITTGTVALALVILGAPYGIDPHFARRHFQTRHKT